MKMLCRKDINIVSTSLSYFTLQTKINALNEVGLKDLKPLFEAWKKFVRALDKDMTTAIKGLKQMWRENEFYLKDAGAVALKSWENFM